MACFGKPKWRRARRVRLSRRDGVNGRIFCRWCAAPVHWYAKHGLPLATMDHVVPRSRGGGHRIENLVIACRDCNMARGNADAPFDPAYPAPEIFQGLPPHAGGPSSLQISCDSGDVT